MTEENTTMDPTPEPTTNTDGGDVLDKFNEIKTRYEKELSDKDKEIEELRKELAKKDNEVNDTIQNLNDEVNDKRKN